VKADRVEELLREIPDGPGDVRFRAYFYLFNRQEYYEAHDVLESLWLQGGKGHGDYAFFKGLIQLAGAFVHLKLHHQFPNHPAHGQRLGPALRLLNLAEGNLAGYASGHHDLDLEPVRNLIRETQQALRNGEGKNPWWPERVVYLPGAGQDRRVADEG
jgi:predicted metal-dependent hydrolase